MEELIQKILLYTLCGCCALLFCIVVFLCITVRRIRRDLNELARNGNIYAEPITGGMEEGGIKGKTDMKRLSSSATRYTVEPGQPKPANRRSAIHSEPDETVTYLTRPGEKTAAQNDGSTTETIALGYVNQAFQSGANADQGCTSTGSDGVFENDQPINSNDGNEQESCENGAVNEPIYGNWGDMADLNNPELPHRSYTMDIGELS